MPSDACGYRKNRQDHPGDRLSGFENDLIVVVKSIIGKMRAYLTIIM
jgi:hypothetical protein